MSEEQQNQSTGIVGEIVEGLHNLEQKVETFLHPEASDNAPSSSEPVQEAGGAAQNPTDASGQIPAPALGTQSDVVAADSASGDPGNANAADTGSSAGAGAAIGTGDDPNAAAPTAGDSSASDMQSSASPVSQVGVGLAIAASVSEAIASRVYTLRKHFWTFGEVTRAPFIKLLDEIEALVK